MNPIARLRARAAARYQAADKTALTNLSFVVAIALAGALLVGVAGYSVYDSTWAPAVEVNSASINKAEAKARAEVTAFQIALQGSRIRARVAAGTSEPGRVRRFTQLPLPVFCPAPVAAAGGR